jgi:predicted metal-dependent phosphoesterase TrpH
MGVADLHIHTVYSDGYGTPAAVLESARAAGMDVIAITDHDEIRGALLAQELAAAYGVGFVPGIEITTADGHLLALFVEKLIPAGLSLEQTLQRVGDQGGLCVAAHPGAPGMPSLTPERIWDVLVQPDLARVLVGVEVYNIGLPLLTCNRVGQAVARGAALAQIANSDSHLLWTIGMSASVFPGRSIPDLRRALIQRETWPAHRQRPVGFFASFVKQSLLRKCGLAYWAASPGEPVRLRQLSQVQ